MAIKSSVKKAPKSSNQWSVRLAENGLRLRRLERRKESKRERSLQAQKPLPSSWTLLNDSLRQLYRNKRLFLGIIAVYGLLYVLFVKGLSANFQLGTLRQSLNDALGSELGTLGTGVALYGLLLGSAGSGETATAGTYQTTILVLVSLAVIWALRQTFAEPKQLRIRDSFYRGMYPLVPFLLTGMIILLQLLPALIMGSLYSVVQSNGLATNALQQIIAAILLLGGLLLSLYWVSSSLFALYIVTLPHGVPLGSLKAAKKLVRFRRAEVIRKVIFLPLILLLTSAIVLIPLIIFIAPAAEVLFMAFTIAIIAVVHGYFYTLYRSLL